MLVNTGQHYDHNMAAIFIDELGMKTPDINLGVGGAGTHGLQTAKILAYSTLCRKTIKFSLLTQFGYIDFMHLQQNTVFLTDSSSIQEESTFFGVPCLTVIENTERPITTTLGTNKLIGIDYGMILQEVDLVLAGNSKEHTIPDLWDGKAANRISKIIDDYFKNI